MLSTRTWSPYFAEQRHGALGLGGVDIGFLGLDLGVATDFGVDDILQGLQLFRLDRLEVAEVETQALAVHQRALLLYVVAQYLAQRGMQQVGRGVVERGGLAYRGVDLGLDRAADAQVAPGDHAMVQVRAASLGGIAHLEAHASRLEVATVADLAAGLGVERRLVEDHDALLALLQALDGLAVPEQRDDLPGAGDALIAEEAGLAVDLDQAVVVHAEGAGSAGALALGLHLALEAVLVDGQLALAGDVIGQVDREAIGVVQLEHHVAGNHAALQFGEVLFEDLQALLQGLGELFFLGLQHALDVCLLLLQLGKASPISATSAATILWKKVPLAPSLLPWRQARRMIRRKT